MKKDLLALIIISSTLGAIAQLSLKTGMNAYGKISFGPDMISAVFQPLVFLGLTIYFLSSVTWILALSKADVSFVYPFASLGYVIVTILSGTILNEQISTLRIIGVSVIILGVYVVGKTSTTTKQRKH